MKAVLTLAFLFTPLFVNAAAQVNYLNIDGDNVHFSTNETKPLSSPGCAIADTNTRYAISLRSEAGRAMYSLLITAMASKQVVTVESAQDCMDVVGIERAKGVSISPEIEEKKSIGVEWAGYTLNNNYGNFSANKSPFLTGSKICAATYPGSRMMLWDDYVSIVNEYPHTYSVWFTDAIASVAISNTRNQSDLSARAKIVYKNGQVQDDSSTGGGDAWYRKDLKGYVACNNWSSAFDRDSGIILHTNGKLAPSVCNVAQRLACVK